MRITKVMEEINEDYTKYSEGLITDAEFLAKMHDIARNELDIRIRKCKQDLESICEAMELSCVIKIDGMED